MIVTREGWQGREGRGRYLRSCVNRTLGPRPEIEFSELAKKRLEIASRTMEGWQVIEFAELAKERLEFATRTL